MCQIKADVYATCSMCAFFAKAFAVLLIHVSEKAGECYKNLCAEVLYLESLAFYPGG